MVFFNFTTLAITFPNVEDTHKLNIGTPEFIDYWQT